MRRTVSITLGGAALLSAGLLAGCMNGGGDGASATTAPPTTSTVEPDPPAPPPDFGAEAAAFTVALTWNAPGEPVDRFELFRDGASLAIVPGTTTSYRDEGVVPGHDYAYQIASQTGELEGERVNADATTLVPPLRAARLEGTFNVTTRFTSKTGYGEYTRPNFGWRFVPRCRSGPCDVLVRDIHERRFRVRLERRGTRYAGTYRGLFTIECEGNRSTSTVEIGLRVMGAAAVDGEWLATRFRGTVEQSEAAQFGCRSAEASMTFRGRLPR